MSQSISPLQLFNEKIKEKDDAQTRKAALELFNKLTEQKEETVPEQGVGFLEASRAKSRAGIASTVGEIATFYGKYGKMAKGGMSRGLYPLNPIRAVDDKVPPSYNAEQELFALRDEVAAQKLHPDLVAKNRRERALGREPDTAEFLMQIGAVARTIAGMEEEVAAKGPMGSGLAGMVASFPTTTVASIADPDSWPAMAAGGLLGGVTRKLGTQIMGKVLPQLEMRFGEKFGGTAASFLAKETVHSAENIVAGASFSGLYAGSKGASKEEIKQATMAGGLFGLLFSGIFTAGRIPGAINRAKVQHQAKIVQDGIDAYTSLQESYAAARAKAEVDKIAETFGGDTEARNAVLLALNETINDHPLSLPSVRAAVATRVDEHINSRPPDPDVEAVMDAKTDAAKEQLAGSWMKAADEIRAMPDMFGPESIAAAAIKMPDGSILEGPAKSHADLLQSAVKEGRLKPEEAQDLIIRDSEGLGLFGFKTNFGRFVDRNEGAQLAELQGQREKSTEGMSLHAPDIKTYSYPFAKLVDTASVWIDPELRGNFMDMVAAIRRGPKKTHPLDNFLADWNKAANDKTKLLPARRFADLDDLGFYSKAERVVGDVMKGPMVGKQLLQTLINKGVSLDELKWTKLDQFLDQDKALAPADVKQFIKENRVKLTEHELGGTKQVSAEISRGFTETFRDYETARNSRIALERSLEAPEVRDGQLAIRVAVRVRRPGGELRLEAPEVRQKFITDLRNDYVTSLTDEQIGQLIDANLIERQARDRHIPFRDAMEAAKRGDAKYESYTLPGGENYREVLFTIPTTRSQPKVREHGFVSTVDTSFQSAHFSQPNIVFHMRIKDRMTPDGKKVLFIEELQSDWHQQGREFGYRGIEPDISKWTAKHDIGRRWFVFDENGRQLDHVFVPIERENKVELAIKEAYLNYQQREQYNRVPQGPFSTTWHEVGMRWALRKAAAEGYDGVAWTTGKTQADRYRGGGEEMAAGQGEFYDQIMPRYFNKLGKRFGFEAREDFVWTEMGSTLEEMKASYRRTSPELTEAEIDLAIDGMTNPPWKEQHSIRIDDKSRKAILEDGMPLFGHGTEKPPILQAKRAEKRMKELHKEAKKDQIPDFDRDSRVMELVGEALYTYDPQVINDLGAYIPETMFIDPPKKPPLLGAGGGGDVWGGRPWWARRGFGGMGGRGGKGPGGIDPKWWLTPDLPQDKMSKWGVYLADFFMQKARNIVSKYGGAAGKELGERLFNMQADSHKRAGTVGVELKGVYKDFDVGGQAVDLSKAVFRGRVGGKRIYQTQSKWNKAELVGLLLDSQIAPDQFPNDVVIAAERIRAIVDDNFRGSYVIKGGRHASGAPIRNTGHALPTVLNDFGHKVLKDAAEYMAAKAGHKNAKASPALIKAASDMVKEGRAKNFDQAVSRLIRVNLIARGRRQWYFEGSRLGESLPLSMREWDVRKVFTDDKLLSLSERVEAVGQFGWGKNGQHPELERLVSGMIMEGGKASIVAKDFMRWWGARVEGKKGGSEAFQQFSDKIRGFQYLSKIVTNPLAMTQNAMDRIIFGNTLLPTRSFITEFVKFHSSPPFLKKWQGYRDQARKSGNLWTSLSLTSHDPGWAGTRVGELASWPYRVLSEGGNQAFLNEIIQGKRFMRDLGLYLRYQHSGPVAKALRAAAFVLEGHPAHTARRLRQVGLDTNRWSPEGLLKLYEKMRRDPNLHMPKSVERGIHKLVEEWAAPNSLSAMRLWDGVNPIVKIILQFTKWQHARAAVIVRDVLGEAVRGNFSPLIRFTIGSAIVGEMYEELRTAIGLQGGESLTRYGLEVASGDRVFDEKEVGARLLNSLRSGGAIAFLGAFTYGGLDSLLGGGSSTIRTVENAKRVTNQIIQEPQEWKAAIMEGLKKETPGGAQLQSASDKIGWWLQGEYGDYEKYNHWKNESMRWKNMGRRAWEDIAAAQATKLIFGPDVTADTENSLALRMAARHVGIGTDTDISEAAKHLSIVIWNKLPEAFYEPNKKITPEERSIFNNMKSAIQTSARLWSPLPVSKDERNEFLAQYSLPQQAEALAAEQRFNADYAKALQIAVDTVWDELKRRNK